eukprot:CAMPEP_0113670468 /NCGR_PEP_ID=MMETSP0038_2-20120614/5158_1 /TAXON_ID=2898 /ORGANISM="Cryptomonas paramecium" /LENGTH=349 /DNA_ID=CAMNT_0000586497 /DNA_START=18 /DNA_END=1063 /DNA_ORIENTATION=- /assembly_acc=CAM_ASM_000170
MNGRLMTSYACGKCGASNEVAVSEVQCFKSKTCSKPIVCEVCHCHASEEEIFQLQKRHRILKDGDFIKSLHGDTLVEALPGIWVLDPDSDQYVPVSEDLDEICHSLEVLVGNAEFPKPFGKSIHNIIGQLERLRWRMDDMEADVFTLRESLMDASHHRDRLKDEVKDLRAALERSRAQNAQLSVESDFLRLNMLETKAHASNKDFVSSRPSRVVLLANSTSDCSSSSHPKAIGESVGDVISEEDLLAMKSPNHSPLDYLVPPPIISLNDHASEPIPRSCAAPSSSSQESTSLSRQHYLDDKPPTDGKPPTDDKPSTAKGSILPATSSGSSLSAADTDGGPTPARSKASA